MSDTLRIKGQETQIRLIRAGRLERTLTAIKSAVWTPKFDILREAYLGETTDRLDDIYRGSGLELTFHPESPDLITLVTLIRERSSRRTPQANAHINCVFSFAFPETNLRPRVTLPDLKFSSIPINIGGRESYIDVRLSAECEDFIPAGV